MTQDPATAMKTRLRADLTIAMRARQTDEVRLLRSLVAALDNAEAPPALPGSGGANARDFADGSAEVDRLALGAAQIGAILTAEADEREQAAAQMDGLGQTDRAAALRAEAQRVRRYLA